MLIAADRTFKLDGEAVSIESIDGPKGRCLYGRFVRFVIRFNRAKRKLFGGSVPEWATNATSLLGHLNLLSVVPTFLAVLFVPKHFFEHVSRRGSRATFLSVPPVRLIFQSAAIAVICLAPVEIKMKSIVVPLVAAAIALTSPVWLGVVVWVIFGIGAVARSEDYLSPSADGLVALVSFFGLFLPVKSAYECLQTLLHWRIDRIRLLWGCCYLSLVCLLTIAVWSVVLIEVNLGVTVLFQTHGTDGDFVHAVWASISFLMVCIGITVAVRRFVEIYGLMIASVSTMPKKTYYKKLEKQLFDSKESTYYSAVKTASSMILEAVVIEMRLRKIPDQFKTYLVERAAMLSQWPDPQRLTELWEYQDIARYLAELKLSEPISCSATLTPQLLDEIIVYAK